MGRDWEGVTDSALSDEASHGLSGQGAVVEAIRRLREAVLAEERVIKTLTKRLYWLTWALVGFAAVSIGLELWRRP